MGWKGFGSKKIRKLEKKWRKKIGITSHNKIGRALKKVQHLFSSSSSASSYDASSSVVGSSGYTYSGKNISQLCGGV